jgi:hypothetical protein
VNPAISSPLLSMRETGLGLDLLTGCLAERFESRLLDEVCSPNTKRLELGAVHSALYPLVHGLAGHRRVYQFAGFFDTVIVAHVSVAGSPFRARAADAEARKSIADVHDCQLYHSAVKRAIAFSSFPAIKQ